MAVEVLPYSVCFLTCMGANFPAVELDNTIWFSTLSRMSGFLWHSSKWACQFSCFLQYMSGLEVLACSLSTNLNYVITMLQLHPSLLNHQVKLWQLLGERCSNFLGGFWKTDTLSQQCSFLDPMPSAEFPAKFINSLDEIPKIQSWFSFDFGLFVLSLYIWLICYLLDS